MTHLILNAAGMDGWCRHSGGGLFIPTDHQPKVLQADRAAAEKEVLRLARHHPNGMFVLFAPVAIAKRVPHATHVNLAGEVVRTENAVRLLTIAGSVADEGEIPF